MRNTEDPNPLYTMLPATEDEDTDVTEAEENYVVVNDGEIKIGKPSNLTAQADTNPAAHYIYVQSSGIVTHDDGSLTNSAETPMTLAGTDITNDPQLGFTLDGSSGKGKITLTHYVWVTPTDMEADPWWAKSSPVSLTMTVTSVK